MPPGTMQMGLAFEGSGRLEYRSTLAKGEANAKSRIVCCDCCAVPWSRRAASVCRGACKEYIEKSHHVIHVTKKRVRKAPWATTGEERP